MGLYEEEYEETGVDPDADQSWDYGANEFTEDNSTDDYTDVTDEQGDEEENDNQGEDDRAAADDELGYLDGQDDDGGFNGVSKERLDELEGGEIHECTDEESKALIKRQKAQNAKRLENAEKKEQKQKEDNIKGKIKWKAGDKITMNLLQQVWDKLYDNKVTQPMCVSINTALNSAITAATAGAGVIVTIASKLSFMLGGKDDTVGECIKIANGTVVNAILSIKQLLEGIINSVLKPQFQLLFGIGVPILNGADAVKGIKDKFAKKE
jgi:hypothetical protein